MGNDWYSPRSSNPRLPHLVFGGIYARPSHHRGFGSLRALLLRV
jgi:hypothetical protein